MSLTKLRMPQLGESVTEGTVDRWLKKEGDFVRRDEPLVEVVTDKVNAEVPSPFEGKLVRIEVPEGTTVAIGTALAQFEVEGAPDDVPAAAPAAASLGAPPAPAAEAAASPVAPGEGDGRQRVSPAVRRLAEENGVDLAAVRGSGLGGRVTRGDVLAYLADRRPAAPASPAPAAAPPSPPPPSLAPPAAPEPVGPEEVVPISAVRRQIAEHMVRSVHTSPHAWGMREVDMSNLVAYREANKDDFARRHGLPLSYLPFVVQVVCEALKANSYLNASWREDGIVLK